MEPTTQIDLTGLFNEGLKFASREKPKHHKRVHKEEVSDETEFRTAFDRDYARVLHSSSFRRLQGKLQLLKHQDSDFYRTRLTHSLEVSQVGEGIARRCRNKKDERVSTAIVRLACLAHDIGNPPFGHHGEAELNRLMKDFGGFEGNAQTLRILCRLEQKSAEFDGLNLCLAARMSVLKYNVTHSEAIARLKAAGNENKATDHRELPQKFIYDEDAIFVEPDGGLKPQTIECQIMDLADDIAYSTHDLEDGLKGGFVVLDDVWQKIDEKLAAIKADCKAAEAVLENAVARARQRSGRKAGQSFEKALSSALIDTFIRDIEVVKATDEDRKKRGTKFKRMLGFKTCGPLVKALKDTTFDLIIGDTEIGQYETTGRLVLRDLFGMLTDKSYNHEDKLFPDHLRERLKPRSNERKADSVQRVACDYLAGMTERFIFSLYERHFGRPKPVYKGT